jgi:hypothetical protein
MNHNHPSPPPFWRSRTGLALFGFLAIAGFFLFTEHRAHVLGFLPFLLLLLCPLLHLFHGHGEQGTKHDHRRGDPEEKP